MGTTSPNTSLLQASKGTVSDTTPAKLTGPSNVVSFDFSNIPPPSMLYVQRDDLMVLQTATSQTAEAVAFNIRILLPNGRIEETQVSLRPANTRAVLTQTVQLSEGYLLSLSALASVAVTRGQTFARAFLNRPIFGVNQPAQTIFADYVTTLISSGYPNGRILAPTEGPGWVRQFQQAAPAAGAEFVVTLPANVRWKITCFGIALTASAAVANRNVTVNIAQNAFNEYISTNAVSITAGQVVSLLFAPLTPTTSVITTNQYIAIPPNLTMSSLGSGASLIFSSTQNLQAGDQYGPCTFLLEEWLENV
jgi:hypothetical protein